MVFAQMAGNVRLLAEVAAIAFRPFKYSYTVQ